MDATRLAAAMEPLEGLHAAHQELAQAGPAEGSVAARDEARPEGHRIWLIANQMWESAMEHALAWRQLLVKAQYQPRSAHYTLLRATFEGIVTSRYLIDQNVSQAVRISRACAQQLEDWRQRRAFEDRAGSELKAPEPPAKRASERMVDLRKSMTASGIIEIKAAHVTDLFDSHGDGQWLYRVLSAHAHGLEWSLMSGSIEEVPNAKPRPGSGAAIVSASDSITLGVTELAVMRLNNSLDELRAYAGR
jgi:hypothetical protein